MTVLLAISMIAALALAAFCAGAETAFMSVNRGRIVHLAHYGSETARIVQKALSSMNRTLTSLLIGNNIAHVVFSAASAALGARLWAMTWERTVWTAGSALAILYLSEFLPKLFCATRPLTRILALSKAYAVFAAVLRPVTAAAMAVTGIFIKKGENRYTVTPNEIMRILQDRKDGVKLTDFESALISRIVTLRRKGEAITVESLLSALDSE